MGLFRSTPAQNGDIRDLQPISQTQPEEDDYEERFPAPRPSCGKETVLGQGQVFVGTLNGEGAVRVDGVFQGDIVLQGTVSVSMAGSLTGTIEASGVLVAGSVEGDITAHGKLRLTRGCRVRGDIRAESLSVEDGAFFDGRSSMLTGENTPAPPGAELPPAEKLQFGKNYVPEKDGEGTEDA